VCSQASLHIETKIARGLPNKEREQFGDTLGALMDKSLKFATVSRRGRLASGGGAGRGGEKGKRKMKATNVTGKS